VVIVIHGQNAMVTILYFARLRETLGVASEQVVLPEDVKSLAALQSWLARRGSSWAQALGESKNVRAAVNQDMVGRDASIADGDEIAFFPPVTGG
jgi:molybdopterin synthase sulfur carrier subunit